MCCRLQQGKRSFRVVCHRTVFAGTYSSTICCAGHCKWLGIFLAAGCWFAGNVCM